jgi:uncharacterized delta-60 repeat protein
MPGYIELDKQASFPPSSNVGKVILGVKSNNDVTITNSDGVTTTIGGGSLPYLDYVSKISSLALTSPKTNQVLSNTLGINPIWERTGGGTYRFNVGKQIDINKSFSNAPISNESFIYSKVLNEIKSPNNFANGFNSDVFAIVVQPDGKILVGGNFEGYNGYGHSGIIRLNTDGSIDSGFNNGGGGFSGYDNRVNTIALQSDGKILCGGRFAAYNGNVFHYIVRLNTDGSIDNTFSVGDGFNDGVNTIAIQPNGKILVGGNFSVYNEVGGYNRIIRLNIDGSVDNSFTLGSWFDSPVFSIIIQPDWKILVGGNFKYYNEQNYNNIVRLNSDASIDTSFVIDGGFDGDVNTIALQSDGKILCGGKFDAFNSTSINRIVRLNVDGSLDGTFSIGSGFNGQLNKIIVQSDGKIICVGEFGRYNDLNATNIVRINNDGIRDNLFVIGNGFDRPTFSIAIESNGKILVGGSFRQYDNTSLGKIARLNTDGSIGFADGFDGAVNYISTQSDGTILVTGNFNSYNGNGSRSIIKLTQYGGVDQTFSGVTDGFNSDVLSMVTQLDGKIICGGNFTSYNGTTSKKIIRLNADGNIDYAFGDGFDDTVRSVTLQSDGKILVGGNFTSYNGTGSNGIVRLNTNGIIDGTFSNGTGFNDGVYSIVTQLDGKIICGGKFTSYNGTGSNHIVRLNSDASIDNTFSVGDGFNGPVTTIAIQSDGKILVGGDFSSYNHVASNRIIRLNTDGTVDSTFGNGVNDVVKSIVVQPNGKIVIGGNFTSYDIYGGLSYIVRINSDGTLDNDFLNTGEVLNQYVSTIALQSNGNILVGGGFTSDNRYSNYIRNYTNDYYYYLFNAVDTLINQEIEIRLYN